MENNIEEVFYEILKRVNEEERKHSEYWVYTQHGFAQYKKYNKKDTLSLNIKIKEKRKKDFIETLNELKINYQITSDNKYYTVFELKQNYNYIILDYVVDSHVIIPNSILQHFGYKTLSGMIVDYIDIDSMTIKSKKTKEYGTVYGYYSKFIEDKLNNDFETKIAMITKDIYLFRNKKLDNMDFTVNKIEDIYNFFDVTTYRNISLLKQVNEQSLSSILIGEYTHDQLMNFVLSENFPHVYSGLKFNVIINETDRDFIISDTMISSIYCDNGNELVIMPINKKVCLALMKEEYYKKYIVDDKLYFMNIDDESEVGKINRYIFKQAKTKKENVIGTKKELEYLLQDN